jgi:hypothetical protein
MATCIQPGSTRPVRNPFLPGLLLCLALRLPCIGADYYVSPSGNDSAAGSVTQPWRTVQRALTGRSPGDVVHLAAGAVFTENVTVGSGGTAGLPVTLTSDPANRATLRQASAASDGLFLYNKGHFTLENVILTGVGRNLTTKAGVSAYADNGRYGGLTFRNVTVTEFYRGFTLMGYGAATYGFEGILMENCEGNYNRDAGALTWAQAAGGIRNLVVRDCRFSYNLGDPYSSKNSGNGFSAGSIWDGLFERCLTHDNGGLGNATAGPVGIMVYDSRRVTIQFCESYRNQAKYQDGDGFDLDLGASDCVIQYCYSHDNYGAGLLLSTDGQLTLWSNNVVRYNISENDGTGGKMGGLHFYSPGSVAPLKNSQVYGNTIYSSISPAVWLYDFAAMSGLKVRNNLFVTANGMKLVHFQVSPTPTPAQVHFQGNNYWSSSGALQVAGYPSLDAWRTATGQERLGTTPVGWNLDPMLVSPGGGGTVGNPYLLNTLQAYRLQAGSPLIDAGLDLPALFGINPGPIDFYAVPIPQGGILDVGAAEYGQPITPTVPAAPSNLLVAGVTATSVALTWSDNAANESGYLLERSTDGVSFTALPVLPANTVSHVDGGLASGATFHYRVRAFNGAGHSSYAGPVSATTLTASLPPAPTGLTAVASTQKGRILLSWQPSPGAASYKVKRSMTSGGPYTTVATGVTTTSYTDGGLRTKTTYYYVVSAVNQAGESPNSNQASAKTR